MEAITRRGAVGRRTRRHLHVIAPWTESARAPGHRSLGTARDIPAALVGPAASELQTALDDVEVLTAEVAHLKIGLGTRGLIGMAIGITMVEQGLGEQEALAHLTRLSPHGNIRLRALAVDLVAETNKNATSSSTRGS